jgi:hypothetical protein
MRSSLAPLMAWVNGYDLSFPSPWVIDILGKFDFDFVFIDGERADSGGSRPRIRDDVAHHSDLMSLGVPR